MARKILADSNVYSDADYGARVAAHPRQVYSSVVVQELMVKFDVNGRKAIAKSFREAVENGNGVTPDKEDWIEVGQAMAKLVRRETDKLSKDEVTMLVKDALIARCAMRAKAIVLTNNLSDFAKIKHVLPSVQFKSPSEYFGGRTR